MVKALGALEVVAAFVELPGFRVLVPVLVCLAERKAQMVAIDGMSVPLAFLCTHASDLIPRKLVGFEIREAPVRIAEARSENRRHPVRLDSVFRTSDALQGMAEGDVQFRRRGRRDDQPSI